METLSGLPTLPEALEYLWDYYCQLSLTRRNYGWGATPIEYAEIEAWGRLCNVSLDPWELETLLRVDTAFLAIEAETEAKRKANKNVG